MSAQEGAKLNESATAVNQSAIRDAEAKLAGFGEQQSKMNYANAVLKNDQRNKLLQSTGDLMMTSALMYGRSPASKGFSTGGTIDPNAGYAQMGQGQLSTGLGTVPTSDDNYQLSTAYDKKNSRYLKSSFGY